VQYPNTKRIGGWWRAAALVAVLAAICPVAPAQNPRQPAAPQPPPQAAAPQGDLMQKIDFEQKLNEQVPLDATFRDETGKTVRLGDFFGDKPVLLTLVYYECPMLCTEILNGTLHMLKEMEFTAGKEFDIVTISIDPREGPELAADKKGYYVRRYGRSEAEQGWHFLVGDEAEIARVADAVGYRFQYDPATDEYAHASGIVVLTPGGKTSRYFYGVQYDGSHVRLGLVEASANKIGSPVDKLLLFCYHYDPNSGQYNVAIMNFVKIFGAGFVVVMVGGIALLMRRERNDKAREQKPGLPVQG
jgi:protein SCO1/2